MTSAILERRPASARDAIAVYNPYTGAVVGEAPRDGHSRDRRDVERNAEAQPPRAQQHPAVVYGVIPKSELVAEETFGPVAPAIRFDTIGEAISISNGTRYGLSSGVCTFRTDWATRFISELRVGSVNIWEILGYRSELSPFGGIKDSGLGQKEGVAEAMKLYTTIKTFSLPWANAWHETQSPLLDGGSRPLPFACAGAGAGIHHAFWGADNGLRCPGATLRGELRHDLPHER